MAPATQRCYRCSSMGTPSCGGEHESFTALWRRRLRRARGVLRQDGPLSLAVAVARTYVVDRHTYRLYEHHHRVWPDETFRPRLVRFEERFVAGNDEAELLARDHEDFTKVIPRARRGLESGAIAFCVYVGREVAHVAWLATSPAGRRALDRLGYEVRFDQGEAWTGAAWTVPSYRGRGLLTYSCRRRFEYLLCSGCEVSRGAVETNNHVSHRATMRFGPRVYATGCLWRVLGRRWWSEREVATAASHGPSADG